MKTLLVILVVVIAALQLKLWFGEGGYRDVQRLAERVEEQARENEILARRGVQPIEALDRPANLKSTYHSNNMNEVFIKLARGA